MSAHLSGFIFISSAYETRRLLTFSLFDKALNRVAVPLT